MSKKKGKKKSKELSFLKKFKTLSKRTRIILSLITIILFLSIGITTTIVIIVQIRKPDIPPFPEYEFLYTGNTLVVDQNGIEGNFTSIQSAIDSASSGDTIEIRNGLYRENLRIEKPVHIKAEGTAYTKIMGDPNNGSFVIIDFNLQLQSCIFEGLAITDDIAILNQRKDSNYYGIVVKTDNVVIQNCRIYNIDGTGINIQSSNGVVVKKCNISNSKYAIEISKSDESYIYYNNFKNTRYEMVMVHSGNDNVIYSNEFSGDGPVVWIENNAYKTIVSENEITDDNGTRSDSIYDWGEDSRIYGNKGGKGVGGNPWPYWGIVICSSIILGLLLIIVFSSFFLYKYYTKQIEDEERSKAKRIEVVPAQKTVYGNVIPTHTVARETYESSTAKMRMENRRDLLKLVVYCSFCLISTGLLFVCILPPVLGGFDIESEKYLLCCMLPWVPLGVASLLFGIGSISYLSNFLSGKNELEEKESRKDIPNDKEKKAEITDTDE